MSIGTVTIRKAETADIGALDRLFLRSYSTLLKPDYPPSALVTAIPVMARAQPALVASGLFYVAEVGGKLAGAGGWSLNAPGGGPGQRGLGHVRHVASDPDQVRQGVGRALLSHILLHAKASGMVRMQCQSTLTAVSFYAAMGFEPLGDINVPLRGAISFPAVLMQARI